MSYENALLSILAAFDKTLARECKKMAITVLSCADEHSLYIQTERQRKQLTKYVHTVESLYLIYAAVLARIRTILFLTRFLSFLQLGYRNVQSL